MKALLTILSLCWLLPLHAQKCLVPYRVNATEWHFVDKYTQKKVGDDYFRIDYLSDSFYLVWKNSKAGLIHASGRTIAPLAYDRVPDYELAYGEMFALKDSAGRIIFFDKYGPAFDWKFEQKPFFRTYYNQGLLYTPYGFIDRKGKVVIPYYPHCALGQFSDNGYCEVGVKDSSGKNVLWGVIDKKNKFILPMKYEYTEMEDTYILAGPDVTHNTEAFDLKGKRILKGKYTELELFPSLGLYSYCKDYAEYVFTLRTMKDSKEISDKYVAFYQMTNDRLLAEQDDRTDILGPNGKIIHGFPVDLEVKGLDPDRITYENKAGEVCVTDKNGKFLFSLPKGMGFFPQPYSSKGYVVSDSISRKMGVVNTSGKIIVPLEYDFVQSFPEIRMWLGRKGGVQFFIDEKGIKYIKE